MEQVDATPTQPEMAEQRGVAPCVNDPFGS